MFHNRGVSLTATMTLFALLTCTIVARAASTVPGIDIIIKQGPCGTTGGCNDKPKKVAMGGGGLPIVPENFFAPGSLPFEGALDLDFDEVIFRRNTPGIFAMGVATIETELLQLSLTSLTPIEPHPGFSYDIQIGMTGIGSIYLLEDGLERVLLDSFFDVSYDIQFIPRDTTPGGTLTLSGAMELEFGATNPGELIPWSNFLPGGGLPLGGSNFVLGSDGMALSGFVLRSPDGAFSLPLITATVPEPTTLALMALAALGIVGARRPIRPIRRYAVNSSPRDERIEMCQ